jgi:hypothetical protein
MMRITLLAAGFVIGEQDAQALCGRQLPHRQQLPYGLQVLLALVLRCMALPQLRVV